MPTPCPSCNATMHVQQLPDHNGAMVELDLCFQCQGMWIDPQENLKLSPAAVADLFKLLYEQRAAAQNPLSAAAHCPRCTVALTKGFDIVRSGRYITYRCAKGHGRFSAFSSFMIEKGFVRQLTRQEIDDIARRATVIHCSSCGAPVDLRNDHACPHCRSALSLLDPTAVERALKGYAHAIKTQTPVDRSTKVADALVMLERDRQRGLREPGAQRNKVLSSDASSGVDLWSIGLALVAIALQ